LVEVWPSLSLDHLVDRMAESRGVIGVDSGLSHIAVALDLPHVQVYRFPTSWRTGPQPAHGHQHQRSVEAQPSPSVDAVWAAWQQVAPVPGVVSGAGVGYGARHRTDASLSGEADSAAIRSGFDSQVDIPTDGPLETDSARVSLSPRSRR
jgi:hypothetical protein